jgi:hypothetical protein
VIPPPLLGIDLIFQDFHGLGFVWPAVGGSFSMMGN